MPNYADLGKIFNVEGFTAESEEEDDGAEHRTDFFGYTYHIANIVPNSLKVVNFSTFFLDEGVGGQIGLKRPEILDLHGKPYVHAYDAAVAVNSPPDEVETVQTGVMDFCNYLEMLDGHSSLGFVLYIANPVPNRSAVKPLAGGLLIYPRPLA